MVCPVQDLGASAWSNISCEPKNPVFTAAAWKLPSLIRYVIKYLVNIFLFFKDQRIFFFLHLIFSF